MALIVAGSTASAQTTNIAVTISGTVVDDTGAPVAGAQVHYNNSPATKTDKAGHIRPIESLISSHVITAKDGSFSITGVAAGFYWLCASGVTPVQLRSCDWGQPTTTVDLRAAARASGVKLQIANGVILTFQVIDPAAKIIDTPAAPVVNGKLTKPGNFRIFAVDQTRFMAATLASAQGAVHTYTLAVPKNRVLKLQLDTPLPILDSARQPVPAGLPATSIPIAAEAATVILNVP